MGRPLNKKWYNVSGIVKYFEPGSAGREANFISRQPLKINKKATRDMARIVEQFSKSSQQLSGAAQDTENAVQQTSQLAQELARRAEDLNVAVSVFRLA
jgi:methyl-accepting chemotaxis protein